MKDRSFQFGAPRGGPIPKANGKMRPLGISAPSPRDKIVQMAFKMLIEPLFEPDFVESSHGFRPNRSPETALRQIRS